MKFNTSTLGFGQCVLGVLVVVAYMITGRGDATQVVLLAGGLVTSGIASIRAADASDTVQKSELSSYGPVGKTLSKEVVKAEDAENGRT